MDFCRISAFREGENISQVIQLYSTYNSLNHISGHFQTVKLISNICFSGKILNIRLSFVTREIQSTRQAAQRRVKRINLNVCMARLASGRIQNIERSSVTNSPPLLQERGRNQLRVSSMSILSHYVECRV